MKKSHSQYYTSDEIASMMVGCIEGIQVNRVLDLGAGDGALTRAVKKRWKESICTVADIDDNNCQILSKQGFDTKLLDCTISNLSKVLGVGFGSIDLAVCNPPYEEVENRKFIQALLKKAHLKMNRNEKNASSDLLFLTYNLLFLRPNGVLAIIVPYSIMTGRNYTQLRQSLLDNYYVERVIELPEKSFAYTEAKTGILIIRKESNKGRETQLNTVDEKNSLSPTITAPRQELVFRLDYSYHKWKEANVHKVYINNADIIIRRGRYTYEYLKKKGTPFFHTTCFNKDDVDWESQYKTDENSIVEQGSFLIARVGKRCVGRVQLIEKGRIQISDCIYGVTVPKEYIGKFKDFFFSKDYSDFISIAARGVCSLYLCKGDLESMLLHKLDDFKREGALRQNNLE